MAYFVFGYFSTKLGTSVDGHEKNNNLKLYYGKCTGKRDFTLQLFLLWQNMCLSLKFLTAEKIRFKKNQTFSRSAQ
jgi:hypothetical protein